MFGVRQGAARAHPRRHVPGVRKDVGQIGYGHLRQVRQGARQRGGILRHLHPQRARVRQGAVVLCLRGRAQEVCIQAQIRRQALSRRVHRRGDGRPLSRLRFRMRLRGRGAAVGKAQTQARLQSIRAHRRGAVESAQTTADRRRAGQGEREQAADQIDEARARRERARRL